MSHALPTLDAEKVSELSAIIQEAGIAGAGGAGFPTYAKWERIDEVDALLVNHQESEPNYYIDKWLGRERAEDLVELFEALLEDALDLVVIGAKEKDREKWMGELEALTDQNVYLPDDLPVDREEESGIVFGYTQDTYQLGMESVLLNMVGDTVIGQDLPMDHGWIVQNTETLIAMYDALAHGEPMTQKYVHVDGEVPNHRFLEGPIGTPGSDLLVAAGVEDARLSEDVIMADGGPGWCFEIEEPPEAFGVRKRTNCLLVLDAEEAAEHTFGNERIDVQEIRDWRTDDQETEPTERLEPEVVHVPMITNPAFEGLVQPGVPVVDPGDRVETGDLVARAADDGISIPHHASVDGTVKEVTDRHVSITRE